MLETVSRPEAGPTLLRYGCAVASIAVLVALTRLLGPAVRGEIPFLFLLFLAPVMISAWYGGLGPGLLAIALATALVDYDVLPPRGSFKVGGLGQGIQLVTFMTEAGFVAYLTWRASKAVARAQASHAQEETGLGRRAQAEAALRETQPQIAAILESTTEAFSTLSHELRSPLSAILGWARVLRSTQPDRDTTERALESIERNVRAQTKLIDDLLDVSRILSGRLRLEVRPVELGPIILGAIETIQPAAAAKAIQLETALDPIAGVISGDPERLRQVVWSLVSNAVKFTPPGGSVQVKLGRRGPVAEIVVTDTGQGIAPELLPHVFERLLQADSATPQHRGGLGLGLAIARHLTDLHGGTIRVDSAGLGAGATFTVTFPVLTTGAGVSRAASATNWPTGDPTC